jgi:hypothetical protein
MFSLITIIALGLGAVLIAVGVVMIIKNKK